MTQMDTDPGGVEPARSGVRALPGIAVRMGRCAVMLLVLGSVGAVANRFGGTAGRASEVVAINARGVGALGQGAVLAILGGFRGLAADALWVRMHATWEKRDLPATDSLVRLVTTIDPRPVTFWMNGARILAYDLCAWRIEAAGGYAALPETMQARIVREQAEAAVSYLETARSVHPKSADLWLEQVNIELNRLRDLEAAAASYRHAAELPGAPYYAARMHGELLRRLGRREAALRWFVALHRSLPPDDAAEAGGVLEKIRTLESELEVTAENVYRAP